MMKVFLMFVLLLVIGCENKEIFQPNPPKIFEISTPNGKFWIEGDILDTCVKSSCCNIYRRGSLVAIFERCIYVIETPTVK